MDGEVQEPNVAKQLLAAYPDPERPLKGLPTLTEGHAIRAKRPCGNTTIVRYHDKMEGGDVRKQVRKPLRVKALYI